MDLITLGAALKGAKTQLDSHFQAGSNILITDNPDGTQTIAASGEVSSEDTVARADIADHVANTSNPHDVKGDQVELHTYAKATEKVAIASSDKVNEALGKLEKKIDDNVINDSTITIQKNGVAVDSFTTNASSAKTINITVPSTASDVGALPNTTKYAGSSSAGGSATSAVKLDNAADAGSLTQPIFFDNGKPKATSYSLAKSVPSDAVFTDTTYESKAAVQSGSDVSLVTTGEKYTWNNKQNAISTSSRLAGNAVNMTGYAKASEQAAISSSDVMTTAIGKLEKKADDNKNNISLSLDANGQKNLFKTTLTHYTHNGVVFDKVNDYTIKLTTASATTAQASCTISDVTFPQNKYAIKVVADGITLANDNVFVNVVYDVVGGASNQNVNVIDDYVFRNNTIIIKQVLIYVRSGIQPNGTIQVMICPTALYDISDKIQPYAMSNVELTEEVEWTHLSTTYTPTTASTWENCGISFNVPGGTLYEFLIMSKGTGQNATPLGIIVGDISSGFDTSGARFIIAENSFDSDKSNANVWVRSLHGLTPVGYTTGTKTWYVWVKCSNTTTYAVDVFYRPIKY